MNFRAYEKIHRIGKEETAGILVGDVHVQEKVDGANTSIWFEDGIQTGSRTRHLGDDNFNGFGTWVKSNECITNFFNDNPTYRLYGEWLVRHTIHYNETSYKKFYLFDVFDGEKFLTTPEVIALGEKYNIPMVKYHGVFHNPTIEDLNKFVGLSELGEKGEGIVLKNFDFVNEFGDKCYAKIVRQDFMEHNALVFGGNNKHSDSYWEMYIVNKYMTLPRIEKIMNKIQPEINKKLELEHTSRVAGSAYHDMMTEEIWEIANKVGKVDFKVLKVLATKKAVQIYKDILLGSLSVADKIDKHE